MILIPYMSGCSKKPSQAERLAEAVQIIAEISYFEGQRDAINGDIKVIQLNDTCWQWIASPWDSGKEPITNLCK